MRTHEGFAVVAGAFVLAPHAMAFPLAAAGLDPGDAIFEAVSGFTTTALSTLDTVAGRPRTLLFDGLAAKSDCGLLHGDGTRPALLREADAAGADYLLSLRGNDQANILSCLVGCSLGAKAVVPRIEDEEFEHICLELGLEQAVIPSRTISR